jgi:hypothetical protein
MGDYASLASMLNAQDHDLLDEPAAKAQLSAFLHRHERLLTSP